MPSLGKRESFYSQIAPFRDFLGLDEAKLYQEAPEDWWVVITDVEGSTAAIQQGRYKIVNMVGAASIAAVVNAVGTREIPFVFGGDGATALIPAESKLAVESSLRESQRVAEQEFGLRLRVGLVPHRDLLAENSPVRVARFELAPGNYLAFFKGRGLTLAENWVKSGRYLLAPSDVKSELDPHEGLSCRWAPLKNTRGLILSILIKVNQEDKHRGLLPELIKSIDKIVGLDHPDSHPVKVAQMESENLGKASRLESSFHPGRELFERLKFPFLMILVKVFSWTPLLRQYKHSMVANSDFRKFDETLRMVVDCSPKMKNEIKKLLEVYHQKGWIYYGFHESKEALMTCFVQDLKDNQHVHFIDGGDGGYAMAAKQMKAQMKADLQQA